ncbi:beta-hexosaminidase subunit beta-like [Haemaphysalis longicornis]
MQHHDLLALSVLIVGLLPIGAPQGTTNIGEEPSQPGNSWRPGVVVPTRGEIWPLPRNQSTSYKLLLVDPQKFSIEYHGSCPVVTNAIERYRKRLLFEGCPGKQPAFEATFSIRYGRRGNMTAARRSGDDVVVSGILSSLIVELGGDCEHMPHLGMDESYGLVLTSTSQPVLFSLSVWGILRGLESFSQLLYPYDSEQFAVNETVIYDSPRFSHRGLLIDTSRHFLPMSAIMDTLDAMAYNKMNVLHWHIVDDQSFPYVSAAFPQLSDLGSYDADTHVYSPDDVQRVISEAAARGIRVMAEFDTPGHTRSWGAAHPELLTTCFKGAVPNGELGPIDPTRNESYTFLEKLFEEVSQVFPDEYIHLGGDEVNFDCWKSNPNITTFMRKLGIPGQYEKLEEIYIQRLLQLVQRLRKSYIVWQEVFDNQVEIAPDTVVHVWKEPQESELENVTSAGYQALLSACWYLDYIRIGSDWKDYYKCDPHNFTGTAEQKSLVLGGEACIWGEYVDATNLISRTWPRASAVAERLWSPASAKDAGKAAGRFEEQRCRMMRRGLRVEPQNGPGFCACDYTI